MDTRLMVLIVGVGTLVAVGSVGAQSGQAESSVSRPDRVRHSGRLVEVRDGGSAIVLDEVVAWTGPGTGGVDRSIQITPRTSIRLVWRSPQWGEEAGSMPGWESRVLKPSDLRPGDFVTVTTDDDHRDVAVALQVVRPGG